MDIIQNLSAKVIFVGGEFRLKPAIPQEVESLDDLLKKYPALKEKFDKGQIVKLNEEQAKVQEEIVNQQMEEAKKGKKGKAE